MIITIMAGEPDPATLGSHAQRLHKRWRLDYDAVATRKKEDLLACVHIGAEVLHWPFLDCIYRRNPQTGAHLYQADSSLFGTVSPSDSELVSNISGRIIDLQHHGEVLAPLAVGNHVDHRITRQVAISTIGEANLSYYEEFPYAIRGSEQLIRMELDVEWKSERIVLSRDALVARIQAMSFYQSQLSTFFEGRKDLNMQVETYIRKIGGERIWRQFQVE